MIKLFVTDIDGCLSKPFEAPDWNKLSQIRLLNQQSSTDEDIPPLSLCTGRPQPYAEAVAQWLNINLPIIFESSGLYHLKENKISFPKAFTSDVKEKIAELQLWMRKEIISQYPGMQLEFAKQMDAGLIHTDSAVIAKACNLIKKHISKKYPGFEVHHTPVSINTMISENNKMKGMELLCAELDIDVSEVAYVGDSSGDISALKIVGHPFAPFHADNDVKKVAKVIDVEETEVVLQAYRQIIEINKRFRTSP